MVALRHKAHAQSQQQERHDSERHFHTLVKRLNTDAHALRRKLLHDKRKHVYDIGLLDGSHSDVHVQQQDCDAHCQQLILPEKKKYIKKRKAALRHFKAKMQQGGFF